MRSPITTVVLITWAVFIAHGCGAVTPTSSDAGARKASPFAAAPTQAPAQPAVSELEKKLERLVNVRFAADRFDVVMEWFRREVDVNLLVDMPALEAAGVEADLPVSLDLKQIPARRVLELVLHQAGSAANFEPIGFRIEEGILHVSTERVLRRSVVSRHYDVADLMEQPPARWTMVTRSGDPIRLVTADAANGPTREEMIEQIVTLIQDTIGVSAEWAAYGGEVSSLRVLHSNMHIKATPSRHAEIEKLLEHFRSMAQARLVRTEREREVAHRLGKAYDLWTNGQSDAALSEAKKALRVDPEHQVAVALKALIEGTISRTTGKQTAHAVLSKVLYNDMIRRGSDTRAFLSPADQAVWKLLDKPITVEWRQAKLKDALNDLAARSGVNLYIDWASIEAAGSEPDHAVTLQLKEVAASVVLRRLMSLSQLAAVEQISFDVNDGVVVISTKRQLKIGTVTEQHDIGDLIMDPVERVTPPDEEPQSDLATRDELIEQLVTLIQDQIGEQADWMAYGGELNSVRELNGVLIVRALPVHQAEIRALLDTMRTRRIASVSSAIADRATAPLLDKADALRLSDKHAEAMHYVEKALIIRPDHPRAMALKTVLIETMTRQSEAKD